MSQQLTSRLLTVSATLLVVGCGSPAAPGDRPGPQPAPAGDTGSAYRWFSLPVQVTGLPQGAAFVPITCPVDFSGALARLGAAGVVDERSLRLYRDAGGGGEVEEPVQFSCAPQPRPKERAALPDTPPGVSYLGEYPAGVSPPGLKVAGVLTWAARAGKDGAARYRLVFGVRRDGLVARVPFPPQNFRVFDGRGRATPVRWFPHMQIRPQRPLDGVAHLFDGTQLVTSYHLGPTAAQAASGSGPVRRPFLYPVNGPDGVALTEFGKPHDPTGSHAHHYSLWVGHASVDGQDFWSERNGMIAHEQLELMEDGPVFCRLAQRTRWVGGGRDRLRELRRLTLYHTPGPFRLLDLELELAPAGGDGTTLGKTSFGFLAARVAQSMTVFDGGGEIVNARGDRNERGAHLKRAEWLDQSGPVAPGKWGGIALLDHPDNPNHPTAWHCRNDGWAGAAFNEGGAYRIKAGEALRLRYRVLLHRGDAARGEVARHYEEFRARPTARVGEPEPRQKP